MYPLQMENISHVNRRFCLRILFFPFFAISALLKSISCRSEAKRYISDDSNISVEERYEKFFSFYTKLLRLKKTSFTFICEKKIPQIQSIFIVDGSLDWNSIVLLRYLVKIHHHHFPSILLTSYLLSKKKTSIFWELIDTFYGINSLESALNSNSSLIVEKDFIFKDQKYANLLKNSHLSIVPVLMRKSKSKIIYKIGRTIKTNEIIVLKESAFEKFLDLFFSQLEQDFYNLLKKNIKKKKFVFRDFFFIK